VGLQVIAGLPRKWSRRVFATYVVVTIFGGVVIALLLILLGLLYWMTAPVKLPPAGTFVTTKSDSAIYILAEDANDLPRALLDGITRGLPSQTERLIRSSGKSRICVVGTNIEGDQGESEPLVAVSLTRSLGRFWLVRRDLEKRVERGKLPYALSYFSEETIFVPDDSEASPVFSLTECSLIRGDTREAVSSGIDLLKKRTEQQEVKLGLTSPGFTGWSVLGESDPPFGHMMSGALLSRWEQTRDLLLKDFPEARGKRYDFWGDFLNRDKAQVHVRFNFGPGDAERIKEWLDRHAEPLGIAEPNVEKDEQEVQLDFSLDFREK
jgi:hypothetical protein